MRDRELRSTSSSPTAIITVLGAATTGAAAVEVRSARARGASGANAVAVPQAARKKATI
jgi:hypothetical protein